MKQKKMICAICGKEIKTYGNNPQGALDDNGRIIHFDSEHVCCDECNSSRVIPGRMITMKAQQIINNLDFEASEDGIAQLRSLLSENQLDSRMYDFIIANWDDLVR